MRVIGVRELKATLSETLRAVGRGEVVRVTLRGRPLADIVPAGAPAGDDRLRRLIVNGQVVPPGRNRPAHAPRPARPSRPASELVLAERDLEP
jgi:prevent-host-death family protein